MSVRRALVVATGAVGLLFAALPAAAAEPAAVGSVDRQSAAVSADAQEQVKDYWTANRMRSATPIEEKYGVKTVSQGKKPRASAAATAVRETPQPTLGKVFFTLGGSDYVCSGTATNSSNGDVVTTAGHCVNEGPGAYATNFAFVPAYENGSAPYGEWVATGLLTTNEWKNSGDFNYDVGFAIMAENGSGQSLTDVVGAKSIGFNLARGQYYSAFGYPAASPYNGETLWSCNGTVRIDTYGGSDDQALPCTMTGGSSGGGWFTGGTLNSVNSFGYNNLADTMFGPYFGSVIQSTYAVAASA